MMMHINPVCVHALIFVLFVYKQRKKITAHQVPVGLKFSVKSRMPSQVRFRSAVDRNGPELSPHAQVLSDHSHQRHAGYVDEPPGEGGGEVGVVDPAADHMKEVYGDCEVQALFPSADEEPQTEGAGKKTNKTR